MNVYMFFEACEAVISKGGAVAGVQARIGDDVFYAHVRVIRVELNVEVDSPIARVTVRNDPTSKDVRVRR